MHMTPTEVAKRANFGDERYENADMQTRVREEFKRAALKEGVGARARPSAQRTAPGQGPRRAQCGTVRCERCGASEQAWRVHCRTHRVPRAASRTPEARERVLSLKRALR